jgi:hypothetical protein
MTREGRKREGSVKTVVLLAIASLVLATPSVAADNDVNGPACVDIVTQAPSGARSFGSYSASGVVTVGVALAAPACSQFEYTVTVLTVEGEQTLELVNANTAGDLLIFQGTVNPETNSTVCVYATTSVGDGRHVFDRAPDTGCVTITKSTSPGFGDFS